MGFFTKNRIGRAALASLITVATFASSVRPTPLHASAVNLTWELKASLLTPRYGHAVASAPNGKIYAISGIGNIGSGYDEVINSVEEYDPSTNTWSYKAPIPTARSSLGAATATNGKIYAIGGNQWATTNEEFDPVANTWRTRQSMTSGRNYVGVVGASNGKVYAIGGSRNGPLSDVEEYDPSTDTWVTRRSIPTARYGHGLVATPNGKIYALGGVGIAGYSAVLGSVEEYDIATDTWTTKANMPTSRFIFAAVLGPDNKIYTIGGSIGQYSGSDVSTVEIYNPATDTWETGLSLTTIGRRFIGGATAVDGKIYIAGGALYGGTRFGFVESLDIGTTTTSTTPTMTPTITPTPAPTVHPSLPSALSNSYGWHYQDGIYGSGLVGMAGDVNHDGYDDALVCTSQSTAKLFLGSASGLSNTPSWSYTNPQGSIDMRSCFGVGDINQDGFDDVYIGADHYDSSVPDAGIALVFNGTASGLTLSPTWSYIGATQGAGAGWNEMLNPGDVNHDGYNDMLVNEQGYGNFSGRLLLFLGSATGLGATPVWTYTTEIASAYARATIVKDLNGDGFDDIALGAQNIGLGQAIVFYGASDPSAITASWQITGTGIGTRLGSNIASAGDVNADGYHDLIVGAYDGAAYVYLGSASGLSATPVMTFAPGWGVGWVNGVGDINGDGFDDVEVGNPWQSTAYVLYGNANGVSNVPAWQGCGGGHCGWPAYGGDFNGDGARDLIVGAHISGDAFVFYGQYLTSPTPTPITATPTPTTCNTSSATWTPVASLLAPTFVMGIAKFNGKIYSIGGDDGSNIFYTANQVLDPIQNLWTSKAPMPTGRWGLGVAESGGKIYAIGGITGSYGYTGVNEAYDPQTDTWETRQPMPTAREQLAVTAGPDGRIYAIGGWNNDNLGTVEIYNPSTDQWTSGQPMPTPRYGFGLVTGSDGKFYAIGGVINQGPALNVVERYDPVADSWQTMNSLPIATGHASAANTEQGDIYVLGGATIYGDVYTAVWKYVPSTDSWVAMPTMNTRRYAAGAAILDGNLYAIGGAQGWGPANTVTDVERLALNCDSSQLTATPTVTASVTPTVTPTPEDVLRIITEPPLLPGLVGQPYSMTIQAAGGVPPYTWSIIAGSLPDGLALNLSSGVISGTPLSAGVFGFTIQVRDSSAVVASQTFASSSAPTGGSTGEPYTQSVHIDSIDATGAISSCSNYTLVSGQLPLGLGLDATAGVINGTPINGGVYNFTLSCVVSGGQSSGQTATKDFTITIVNPAPIIYSLAPTSTIVGDAAITLTVNGAGFVVSSTAQWNGDIRPIVYLSSERIQILLSETDVMTTGIYSVTVVNPSPNGGISNVAEFVMLPPYQPTVSPTPSPSVTPTTTPTPTPTQIFTQTLTKIHVYSGAAPGVGHQGYLVRLFNAQGVQVAAQTTDANGDISISLANGNYQYRVDKAGAQSIPRSFTATGASLTLGFRLASVTVNVIDSSANPHAGYLTRVLNGINGTGTQFDAITTDALGVATYYLLEGSYGYRVDKAGAASTTIGFVVQDGIDQTLQYTLSKVTIRVVDDVGNGYASYLVRLFNGLNGTGAQWGSDTSDENGDTSFYLVDGSYGYRVDKAGATSVVTDLAVAAGVNQTFVFVLSKATIHVVDPSNTGQLGYLVRVFNGAGGTGTQWGSDTTNVNGDTSFYLVNGTYSYRVDKAGATGTVINFTMTSAISRSLVYTLAKITVNVVDLAGLGRQGFLVRVFNGVNGSGAQWGSATSDANGNASFLLPDGSYGYRVDKAGATSAIIGFSATAGNTVNLTYMLAKITIHVQTKTGAPANGYLVRLFNGATSSGTQWGTQTTNALGDSIFYVPDSTFQFQVEKASYNSGRLPMNGIVVASGSSTAVTHSLP